MGRPPTVFGGFRVVLGEPDPAERARLRTILEATPGFEVSGEAQTGVETVELAERGHPHVVLLSLDLPDLAGYELLPALIHRVPEVPVVVISRPGNDAAIRLALRLGAVDCMPSGSSPDAVVAMVRRAVGELLVGRRADALTPGPGPVPLGRSQDGADPSGDLEGSAAPS